LKPYLKTALFGTALLLSSTSVTWALDKDVFVASVAQKYGLTKFRLEKVEVKANTITLYNVATEDGSFEHIVFNNIIEQADGFYTISSIKMDKIESIQDSMKIVIKGLLQENAYIPVTGKETSSFKHIPYSRLTIHTATFDYNGKPVLRLKEIVDHYEHENTGAAFRWKAKVDSFDFNGQNLPAEIQKTLSKLDYTAPITGHSDISGNWNPETGDVEVSRFNIAAKDVGTLHLGLKLQGITPDIGKKIGKNTDPFDQNTLEILKQIKLKDFNIRFEDSSLTNRVLDQQAHHQKTTRENVITQARLLLPLLSYNLGSSNFAKKLSPELGTFLQKPKSLEVSAAPSQTASLMEILETLHLSPADALNLINADITANQ